MISRDAALREHDSVHPIGSSGALPTRYDERSRSTRLGSEPDFDADAGIGVRARFADPMVDWALTPIKNPQMSTERPAGSCGFR
jgi:hypothetical protein